ncbi:MAG: restriction endonuclease subunit S [Pseudomonadota bacterium]
MPLSPLACGRLGMAGDWHECALGDVIELKRGYDLPQQERRPGAVPIVSSSGVTDYHAEAMATGPGVVTGRYGTLGQVFYIEQGFWPLNTTLYVRNFKGNDPRFISYFMRSLDFLAYSDKAAVPGVNRNHLHQARVVVPTDVGEQRAIAHILGTLDDKIELSRQMNETLEAMARTLFKSWFVDYAPARPTPDARDPGLPKPIADLFPDRLVDSDLGEIPEWWEVGKLGDVAEHPRRSEQPDTIEPDVPYIALEHMPKRCIALSDWGVAEGLESNKFGFKKGEILFGKLRPYFHKVGVAPCDGVCSTDIVVVAPQEPHWFAFVLGLISSDEFVEFTNAGSTGTKMPRTSWADMARYELVKPPSPIAKAFTDLMRPSVERIIAGIHESRSLALVRDALLPKLISGELRVRDAERIAAGVAA